MVRFHSYEMCSVLEFIIACAFGDTGLIYYTGQCLQYLKQSLPGLRAHNSI